MSLAYRLMYAIGFAPWDRGIPDELTRMIEGPNALPAGRALDLGSGMGNKAIYLASKGWHVTAVEAVPRAQARAKRRADHAKVAIDWRLGDVTRLSDLALEPGFDLFFDFGCFHGLNDRQRSAYAAGVAQLAAPRANLLMMAFRRARPPIPGGVSSAELLRRFPGWELAWENTESSDSATAVRGAQVGWFHLRRSARA